MAANKLTVTELKRLISIAVQEKRILRRNDGEGLYFCAESSGKGHWEFRYKKPDGRDTYMRLGAYPSTSLSIAREEKSRYRDYLKKGIDPQLARSGVALNNKISLEITFSEFARVFIEANPLGWKAETLKQKSQIINNHISSRIGCVPVKEITSGLLLDSLKDITSKHMANKSFVLIRDILVYAEVLGVPLCSISFDQLQKYFKKPKSKHFAAVNPDELRSLIQHFVESNTSPIIFCLFLWQLHLLLRPKNAATSQWRYIDLEARVIVFPKVKTDENFAIPLSTSVMKLLSYLSQYKLNDQYIFPSQTGADHASPGSVGNAIRSLGYKGVMTSHGTRSVGSTKLYDELISSEVVEACLSHIDKNLIRSAYYRERFLSQRVAVMQLWSDFIDDELRAAVKELAGRELPLLEIVNEILSQEIEIFV
ncbi:tyrosine-type recombinase/integrase [Vibrio breoganii]